MSVKGLHSAEFAPLADLGDALTVKEAPDSSDCKPDLADVSTSVDGEAGVTGGLSPIGHESEPGSDCEQQDGVSNVSNADPADDADVSMDNSPPCKKQRTDSAEAAETMCDMTMDELALSVGAPLMDSQIAEDGVLGLPVETGAGGNYSDMGSDIWGDVSDNELDLDDDFIWPPIGSIVEDCDAMVAFARAAFSKIADTNAVAGNMLNMKLKSVGTIFSGTDVCIDVLKAVCTAAARLPGVVRDGDSNTPDHVFSCDNDKVVQSFLHYKLGPETAMFGDVKHLAHTYSFDVKKKMNILTPSPSIVIAGWPCRDFSSQSSRSAEFKDAMKQGRLDSLSATGFADMVAFLSRSKDTTICIGENVPGMNADDSTNMACALRALDDIGIVCQAVTVDPFAVGIPQHRKRWYFLGVHWTNVMRINRIEGDAAQFRERCMAQVTAWVKVVEDLTSMDWPIVGLDSFLLKEDDLGIRSAISCREAKLQSRASTKLKYSEAWKSQHATMFAKANISSIMKDSLYQDLSSNRWFDSLVEREKQVIVYHAASSAATSSECVVDTSQSLSRSKVMMDTCQCILPKAHLYLMKRRRTIVGVERMALQGVTRDQVVDALTEEQLNKLAGNAFNGFAVAIVLCSLLSTVDF
eukprot:TRINITY_DN49071_c0_g1_i1.p1 TRINITY_DN49071_c0_g1~~TRINITY_DN49071_c0_g1_i1.p1  ORF type:complete len:662 (-),score=119.97 TRINITY_DN49071_c0_g1_i1:239-2149(-)